MRYALLALSWPLTVVLPAFQQLDQFVTIALAFLKQDAGASDTLTAFATQHGVKEKPLRNTIRGVLFFFGEALKKNMAPQQVKEDLTNLGELCWQSLAWVFIRRVFCRARRGQSDHAQHQVAEELCGPLGADD